MTIDSACTIPTDLKTLFAFGRVGDLSDGALLERFLATRDESAFACLVGRHGPMVLRVCVATLADPGEVDDAFQAVFLILYQQARAIRSRDSVASWLYGVAARVSARARVNAARRRKHERRAAGLAREAATGPVEEAAGATKVLHEEVARLPDRYREAVVLCYFESHTCDEAARRTGRPVGTLKARLSRARGLLKQRLVRRGVSLSAALAVMEAAEAGAAAPVPPELVGATLRSITGAATAPARVILLAQGVIGSMRLLRIQLVAACVLTAAVGAGAVMAARGATAPPDESRGPQVKDAGAAPAEKPPAPAIDVPEYEAARRALDRALPAATAAADPYLMTFALIRLAKAQAAAGDRAAALETFVRADRTAGTVTNEHLRRLALMRTAVARGRIGDAAPARATLQGFAHEGAKLAPEPRYNLMSMVIDFHFQAGFPKEARALLEKELAAVEALEEERARDGGIYRLLYSQLTLGDYDGALLQAARYTGERSNLRASLLQAIMNYHRETDARPSKDVARRALELSREITYPYPRALAQGDIAAALARAGDVDGGLAVVREIGEGDPERIMIRGSEVPSALAVIAREQARAGAREAALESLREARAAALELTQRDSLFSDRIRKVAEAQAELGDVAGAKFSIAAIGEDNVEKPLALVALARGQAKAGDRAAAAASLAEAVALARDIRARANLIGDDPDANADRVFREIAVAQAEAGDAKGAIATVAGRKSDSWKSEALAAIAPIQARQGDVTGALATARSIPDATRSGEAYGSIASHQARAGDAAAALAWASQLEAPAARAFALIGITEGLAARKAAKPERGTRTP